MEPNNIENELSEPVFSTRVSIKWDTDLIAHEPTSTWVFTASNGNFVDTRINSKTNNPEWLITGEEENLDAKPGYQFSIKFVHLLDSLVASDDTPGADIGHFKSIEGSNDRLEEGSMVNPNTHTLEAYQEVWRTLNPLKSDLKNLLPIDSENTKNVANEVWDLNQSQGRFIRIGDFAQGVAIDGNKKFQCIRLYKDKIVYHHGQEYQNIFDLFIDSNKKSNLPTEWIKTFSVCM